MTQGLTWQFELVPLAQPTTLSDIADLDSLLYRRYENRFLQPPFLSRQMVSFQANKKRPIYRWYKFKEAFSASLVEYLLSCYDIRTGRILDPFAGSGTTLFAASTKGIAADGIELLPVGQQVITARLSLERGFTRRDLSTLDYWVKTRPWRRSEEKVPIQGLRIADGAYPSETQEGIERYIGACPREGEKVQIALRFALLCVLESVSYTRKDGQYLRWDHRSGRHGRSKKFQKRTILDFDEAIAVKIEEILSDLQNRDLFSDSYSKGVIRLLRGSCLDLMPGLPSDSYDAILTSPPYCNRYDYTRTYALELALLGIGEKEIVNLRQRMLSCTVENREKDLQGINPRWGNAVEVANQQESLQAILTYLEEQKAQGKLNNNGLPRMVRGYFYEMACVIAECARVLTPGALMFMVNDNVRYAGASISVDVILSDMAEGLGFRVENILVLPNGKGNSSQQMGRHGRDPLRKCVYVWSKV